MGAEQPSRSGRVVGPSDEGENSRAVHPREEVKIVIGSSSAHDRECPLWVTARHGTCDDDHPLPSRPAKCRGAPEHELVEVIAQEGVDDEGLEPGVPSATSLSRARIDLCRCEGDLTGIQQDRLAQRGAISGLGELFDRRLHDRDGGAHEGDGLLEAEDASELAGSGSEDIGRERSPAARGVVPVDECRDARLRDEADPAALLRAEVAIPGQALLHEAGRRGREGARRLREPW